jgi:ferredoxin-nitrate reductase
VPEDDIREAARIIGTAERMLSTVLQGVYQSNQATAAACGVNNLHLLRGMLGRPGAGVLQMNGLPSNLQHHPYLGRLVDQLRLR